MARVPMVARLSDGSTTPWHRVGTVVSSDEGWLAAFDEAAAAVEPAWWARDAVGRAEGAVVEFGAVVGGRVVLIARSAVTGRVVAESGRRGPRRSRMYLWGAQSAAPAPLRSGFPDPSRIVAGRRSAA